MTHHVLSLGAGVNSTALLHLLIDKKMPLDEVIFADTGAEKPETYEYIRERILTFLAQHGIAYAVVRAKETLIERCVRGHTVPDRRYRWSTRDYKIRPIYKYLKPRAPVVCYLGIAADEPDRVKQEYRVDWVERKWPLVEYGITRDGCETIIREHGWPLPVKSGCFFCPFTRLNDWRTLWKQHPELYAQAIQLEQNGSKYPEFTLYGKPKGRRRARKNDPQTYLSPLVPGPVGPAGLEKLAERFAREELAAAKSTNEQSLLNPNPEQEECEGFCFT